MSLERNVRSAGSSFLRKNLSYIQDHYYEITNDKGLYTNHLFENQDCWYDSNLSGTITRVNSALRIIRFGDFEDAVEMISSSQSR